MVAQLLQEKANKSFSDEEKAIINWSLKVLWGDDSTTIVDAAGPQGFESQKAISELLEPRTKRELASMYFKFNLSSH